MACCVEASAGARPCGQPWRIWNCSGSGGWLNDILHDSSRGQQQRVAIARGFTSDAKIILADEPTGSLDPATAEAVMAECRKLSQRTGNRSCWLPITIPLPDAIVIAFWSVRETASATLPSNTKVPRSENIASQLTAFNNPDGSNRPTVVALPLPQTR